MSAVEVFASLSAYRAATAELPRRARPASAPAGAVAVVDGSGRWSTAALAAIADGATGIVISRPASVPSDDMDALTAAGVPIIVERPLLRPDVAALAAVGAGAPAVFTVECHARTLDPTLRDAVGYARVAAGGPLALRAASFADGRGLALLDGPESLTVSLIAATQSGAPDGGRIRVTGLGETLVEVDGEAGALRVETADAASRRTAPRRWESSERLTLRRAIDAVITASVPRDIVELGLDEALAHGIVTARRP